jgi:selenophosphate synthase
MSDVWAIGGEPVLALNLVAFPPQLSTATLGEILRGGAETVRHVGAVIAGGHSIQDKETKYGLRVVGFADSGRLLDEELVFPGEAFSNRDHFGGGVHRERPPSDAEELLLFDPQTSGGLLVAVPKDREPEFLARLSQESGRSRQVGEVCEGEGIEVLVT